MGICLWSHIGLTKEINICIHSFSLPLIAYELIHHSTQISQHYDELNIISLRIYEDMYSQLQILQYRVSTYSRSCLKGINLENEN